VPETLESMPALRSLYARAVLQAVRPGARSRTAATEPEPDWSSQRLRLTGVQLSGDRLTAYRSVCGFAAADTVPATYPQALAFPLQLRVMTSRQFPFPAMGAVHIANAIEQYETLRSGAVCDLSVHATDLRLHPRGRQVTVVTEAEVAGQPVWQARSDYLRIERAHPRTDRTPDVAGRDTATPSVASASWELGADLGRRYAAVTGDRNPIHLYDVTARLFGFPRHIAHGMWTLARCLAELGPELPDRMRCDVTFRRPVPLPGRVEFTASELNGRLDFSVGSSSAPDRHLRGMLEPR
jgi:MaoC dehydratase-like protein